MSTLPAGIRSEPEFYLHDLADAAEGLSCGATMRAGENEVTTRQYAEFATDAAAAADALRVLARSGSTNPELRRIGLDLYETARAANAACVWG